MSESKLLRGTLILSLGTYVSRFLGMLYLFPFYYLVGEIGSALYGYGYAQYTIFLFISTAGFPLAVSKFVAKYNALGDFYTGRRILKSGLWVMSLMGVIGFTVLYFLAPLLAPIVLAGSDTVELDGEMPVISVEDVVFVIRMVSFALLVVPIMSLLRGFFQGHQSMGPTAISQVVEQVVRIMFLLSASYIVIKVIDGEIVTAVAFSTFAAFIGGIAGLAVLVIYWFKRKSHLDHLLQTSKTATNLTTKQMYIELLSYAGPFVLVGLAIPLYNYIDQFTFNRGLVISGKGEVATQLYAITTLLVPKLVMIPVSLATAFSLTLVPTITNSFSMGDFSTLRKQIDKTFQICMLLVLPAVVGLSVLAYPAYGTLFEISEAGGNVLRWYAPVALLFSYYTISAAILQGINKQKFAVLSLFFGLIIKAAVNTPFIIWFGEIGSILATALGYSVSIIYCFLMIKRHAKYSFRVFFRRSILMGMFGGIMAISVLIAEWLLSFSFTYDEGRGYSVIVLSVGIAVGAIVYLYLAYRSHLLEKLLGNKVESLINRVKRRKAVQ